MNFVTSDTAVLVVVVDEQVVGAGVDGEGVGACGVEFPDECFGLGVGDDVGDLDGSVGRE